MLSGLFGLTKSGGDAGNGEDGIKLKLTTDGSVIGSPPQPPVTAGAPGGVFGPRPRVVTSWNRKSGVICNSPDLQVRGLWSGVGLDGVTPAPNQRDGLELELEAQSAQVGGWTPGAVLLSGNERHGLTTFARNTRIAGLFAGVSADGIGALPNREDGCWLHEDADNTTVGAGVDGAAVLPSVFSANGLAGIRCALALRQCEVVILGCRHAVALVPMRGVEV